MRFYIAAPIFTPPQIEVVEMIKDRIEHQGRGHIIFSPYHNSQEIFAGRKPAQCSKEERAKVLDDNIASLDYCDVLLAWVGGMGGFTDPGVVWEMGYCHRRVRENGMLPTTIAYIDDTDARPSMNLMLAGTVDAVVIGRKSLKDMLWHLCHGSGRLYLEENFPVSVLGSDLDPLV